jgi:hypothetical protein
LILLYELMSTGLSVQNCRAEAVVLQLLDVDRKRQAIREGQAAVKKQESKALCAQPVWIQLSPNVPILLPVAEAQTWLELGMHRHCKASDV